MAGPASRLFCLAPAGVFRAADLTADAVGSYPTFSPLPSDKSQISNLKSQIRRRRYILCDTVRRRALTRASRACGEARTAACPVVSGLSSPGVISLSGAALPAPWDAKNPGATIWPRNQEADIHADHGARQARRRGRTVDSGNGANGVAHGTHGSRGIVTDPFSIFRVIRVFRGPKMPVAFRRIPTRRCGRIGRRSQVPRLYGRRSRFPRKP